MQTLELTPTWREASAMIAAILENGTPEGRSMARAELTRMADALDAAKANDSALRESLLDVGALLRVALSPRATLDRGQAFAALRDAESALGHAIPSAHGRD